MNEDMLRELICSLWYDEGLTIQSSSGHLIRKTYKEVQEDTKSSNFIGDKS